MKTVISILIIFISLNAFGSYRPFDKYDFESGEFILLGVFSIGSDKNDLVEELKEFYIDDIEALKKIKRKWKFTRNSPMYACGYHYDILLVKNGKVVENFSINLNCNEIVSEAGAFYFNSELLSDYKNYAKRAFRQFKSFGDRKVGFEYLDSIKKDSNYITTIPSDWEKYEGKFEFRYDKIEDYKSYDSFMDSIHNLISEKYGLNISTSIRSISPKFYEVEVLCNKTVYDSFNLFPITEEWKYLKVNIRTYWKRK